MWKIEWGWRVVAHAVSVPIAGTLAVVAWRNRTTRGSRELACLLLAIVVWNGMGPFTVAAESPAMTTLLGGLMLVTLALTVYALLEFTLVYTGRGGWLTPRRRALLLLHPAALLVLTITDATVGIAPGPLQQSLVFESVVRAPAEFYGTDAEWGPAFWVHLLYSYALVGVSTYLVIDLVNQSNEAYDGQGWLLVAAIAVPWVTNVVDIFTPLLSNTLGLAFCTTGVALFVGVRSHDLSGVTPVTRDSILDSLDGGVLVLDDDDRIVDCNPAARSLLDLDEADIGRFAGDALAHLDDVWQRYADVYDTRDEVAYETDDGWRHFSVQISTLGTDDRARSILIHDITERVRREQELESQRDRLDQFASILSHDLRNPLNVAQGRLEMVDGNTETLAAIERSHGRMESLIDEVLTLTRTGRAVSETEPVDVDAIASEAWQTVDTGSVSLVVGTDRFVEADPERLRTAFENLFRNAIEHGGPDLTTVRVGTDAEDAVFAPDDRGLFVADDGVGIPDDDRETVRDAGHTTDPDGTGLGLSIVESVADGHGWSLSVGESRAGGARIEFRGVLLRDAADPNTHRTGDGSSLSGATIDS